jgi:predicted transcriptional regulator
MTKTQSISLRLDTTTFKILSDIATQEDTPLSYVIRKLIRNELKRAGYFTTAAHKPTQQSTTTDSTDDWE